MNLIFTFAAGSTSNSHFLPHDINEFYWGAAAFLVVVGFLMWKVRPPIQKRIKEAKAKTVREVNEAQAAVEEATDELKELKSKLSDMSAERERILAEARVNAEILEKDLMEKADQEAKDLKVKSLQDVALFKKQVQSEIQQELAKTALMATENIVLENLNPRVQTKLLNNYISSSSTKIKVKK